MASLVKLCSIMVMDALVSNIWTSIASGSGLACVKLGMDTQQTKPRISKRMGHWSLVTLFAEWLIVAVTCFMDRTVYRTTRPWIPVGRGLIFCGFHLAEKNAKITRLRKIPAIQ